MFCHGSWLDVLSWFVAEALCFVLSWFVCVVEALCVVVVRMCSRSCIFCHGSYVK